VHKTKIYITIFVVCSITDENSVVSVDLELNLADTYLTFISLLALLVALPHINPKRKMKLTSVKKTITK